MMRKVFGILRKKARPKETTDSNFKTMIQKAIDGEGGTVHLFRYDPESAAGLNARLSPFESDVKDWKDRDVESYLNQVHGGGRYRVRIDFKQRDGTEREAKMFDFTLAGEPKEGTYESKKTKQAEQQTVTDIFKIAVDVVKQSTGGGGESTELFKEFFKQNTELQKQNSLNMLELQKHNDTMMMEMQKRNDTLMLELRRDREAGSDIETLLENMMRMKEFESTIQPKLEQNDTVEMIKAIASVAPVIAAFRTGIMPQQEPVRMIEAATPGAHDTDLVSPSNGRAELGAPRPATRGTPSVTTEATPPIELPNGTTTKRDEFAIVMLDPLLDQINVGASPHQIAIMIKTIIDWSFFRAELHIKPHESVLGMITALAEASQGKSDIAAIEKAYNDFVAYIEMPAELIEPVRAELWKIYLPLFTSMQRSKDAGGVEDENPAE